jgi:hypothetical protein
VPDFSTLSRRQKALAVNIPHRGGRGPLHLLIVCTGSRLRERTGGMRASMATRNAACGARRYMGSTSEDFGFGLLKSPAATWVTRPCCLNCSARSLTIRRSLASLPIGPTTRASAMTPSPNAGPLPSFHRERMPSRGKLRRQARSRATRR